MIKKYTGFIVALIIMLSCMIMSTNVSAESGKEELDAGVSFTIKVEVPEGGKISYDWHVTEETDDYEPDLDFSIVFEDGTIIVEKENCVSVSDKTEALEEGEYKIIFTNDNWLYSIIFEYEYTLIIPRPIKENGDDGGNGDGSPGFEAIFVMSAIGAAVILFKRQRPS